MAVKAKTNNRVADVVGESQSKIQIPALALAQFDVTIEGLTPLITHKFDEKVQKQIEDKQQQKATQRKQEKRNPKAEYLAACYVMPSCKYKAGHAECRYGFPANGIKSSAVSACRYTDLAMTVSRGVFFVLPQDGQLVEVKFGKMEMVKDSVRLPNKSGDIRYRPYFYDWSITFRIEYNTAVISPSQIVNLLNNAGFGVGIGDWRPETKGVNGRFRVKTA